VNELPEDQWRNFVEAHPQANIFHTPEMFQVFARVHNHRPTLWAAVDDDTCPWALLPVVNVTTMNGVLRGFTTRAVAYGSVLYDPGPEGERALATLLRTYERETKAGVLFTELRNLSDLGDGQSVLHECGFAYEGHLNFLVDLDQSEEAIWRRISKSGRQGVRTSRNKGTVVEEVVERQKIAYAYRMLQEVYNRVQVPLASPALFEAAFDVLGPQDMFKVFLARVDAHYIGTCLLLLHKGRIIYWYAGSDRAFSSHAPGELLIWHALQWGKEHHFRVFDFGGAGKPDEDYGPRRFKAKFGGDLVEFGRNTYVHSDLRLQISRFGYSLYRQFL
jgi:lipid II:glycine glycyltransferase (peptidoglycan interpeptide bridge formation enzyme)